MKKLNDEQMNALREYAEHNGRAWRERLIDDWVHGRDGNSPLLRQVRNTVGPSGLMRIKLEQV